MCVYPDGKDADVKRGRSITERTRLMRSHVSTEQTAHYLGIRQTLACTTYYRLVQCATRQLKHRYRSRKGRIVGEERKCQGNGNVKYGLPNVVEGFMTVSVQAPCDSSSVHRSIHFALQL